MSRLLNGSKGRSPATQHQSQNRKSLPYPDKRVSISQRSIPSGGASYAPTARDARSAPDPVSAPLGCHVLKGWRHRLESCDQGFAMDEGPAFGASAPFLMRHATHRRYGSAVCYQLSFARNSSKKDPPRRVYKPIFLCKYVVACG